jgi:hypothetical protein
VSLAQVSVQLSALSPPGSSLPGHLFQSLPERPQLLLQVLGPGAGERRLPVTANAVPFSPVAHLPLVLLSEHTWAPHSTHPATQPALPQAHTGYVTSPVPGITSLAPTLCPFGLRWYPEQQGDPEGSRRVGGGSDIRSSVCSAQAGH